MSQMAGRNTTVPMHRTVLINYVEYCRDGRDDLTDKIDFIVCLGGDGTLLYASLLFQQSVPPVMAFHLGSLGFLTPFQFDNFQEQVTNVLEGHAALTLRSRLRCIIVRKNQEQTEICDKNWITQRAIANEENSSSNGKQQKTAANILVSIYFMDAVAVHSRKLNSTNCLCHSTIGIERGGHRSGTLALLMQY